ncbi:hypothetical protein VaNZ11_010856 [Volvox africanus]|uniref:Uncharacterized protein n=1 Tax=Volvox africanus TaxID=51714 RepID=A0ABQ5SB69_9CHLO|nr:hypothetical protein VaNZ11_010856 [Volvox africanus]
MATAPAGAAITTAILEATSPRRMGSRVILAHVYGGGGGSDHTDSREVGPALPFPLSPFKGLVSVSLSVALSVSLSVPLPSCLSFLTHYVTHYVIHSKDGQGGGYQCRTSVVAFRLLRVQMQMGCKQTPGCRDAENT